MAKTIDIAVKVTDAASQPLKQIDMGLKAVGRSAVLASKKFGTLDKQLSSSGVNLKTVTGNFGRAAGGIKSALQVAESSIKSTNAAIKELNREAGKLNKLSKPLNNVSKASNKVASSSNKAEKGFKQIGKAAKKTEQNITEFNRSLFGVTAFIGTFTLAARGLASAMMESTKMDRVVSQFEKAVGPKGKFIEAIKGMTDNSIDYMEAMRSGIALSSLGISTDMNDIAGVVARAGTAAKMAGLESSEGIKKFTQFLKDGSISHLEFLNMMKKTDTGLILSESILSKYGGVMGKVMTVSQRMAMAQDILRRTTKSSLKGQRDYADILFDLGQAFSFARKEASLLITAAIAPLLDKVKDAVWQVSSYIETIRKADDETLFLVKSFMLATSSVLSFVAVLGTLRLSLFALSSLGIGLPAIIAPLLVIGSLFLAVGKKAETFKEKLQVFGAVFKGVYQLVSSFLTQADLYKRGVGTMDKATADLLRKHGLHEFVTTIAKGLSYVGDFIKTFVEGFKEASSFIISTVSDIGNKFLKFIGLGNKPGSRKLLNFVRSLGKNLGKVTATVLALTLAFKGLSIAKGLLSKIPIIGKFFAKDKTDAPKGTANDPIYTKSANAIIGSGTKKDGLIGKLLAALRAKPAAVLNSGTGVGAAVMTTPAATNIQNIVAILKNAGKVVGRFGTTLARFIPTVLKLSLIFAVLATYGYMVFKNWDKLKSLGEVIWLYINDGLSWLREQLVSAGTSLLEAGKDIVSWIGKGLAEFGTKLGNYLSPIINPIKTQFSKLVLWLDPIIEQIKKWAKDLVDQETKENISAGFDTFMSFIPGTDAYEKMDGTSGNDLVASSGKVIDLVNKLDVVENRRKQQGIDIAGALGRGDKKEAVSGFGFGSQEHIQTQLKATQGALKGEQKERFASAFTQAMDDRSASGKEITKEEYEKIMRSTLGEAVSFITEPLYKIENKTVTPTNQNNRSKRSGAC